MATQTISAKQITQPDLPRNRSAALEDIIRHFAGVSGRSPDEVRREIEQMGGNVVVTDKEAKAVFAHLEAQYHRDDLFGAKDLCSCPDTGGGSPGKPSPGRGGCVDPAEDTSMCDLVDIIAGKLGI